MKYKKVQIFYLFAAIPTAWLLTSCAHHQKAKTEKADQVSVKLESKSGSNVSGVIGLEEKDNSVIVHGTVVGLEPNSTHGFHIHELGDCSAEDGSSAGGHYAPHSSRHGKPRAKDSHLGDLGNIEADKDGVADFNKTVAGASLGSGKGISIRNRAFIVHKGEDDLTSQPSGAAGARVACGVIPD